MGKNEPPKTQVNSVRKPTFATQLPGLLFTASCLGLFALGPTVSAATIDVCPETNSQCTSIYAVNWPALTSADTVVVHGGVYTAPIFIYNVTNGTKIVNDGTGEVFINSLVAFINSRNISWDGRNRTHIQNTGYPGVAILQGSTGLNITGTEISHTALGIWIGNGAGCGHRIDGNAIRDNYTHGVAIDRINCSEGNETTVSNNTITGNLYHGIELHANYYIVEHNEVARNGLGMPGTSGIHVYSANPWEGSGQHNVIRYNVSHDNSDIYGPDGNGIQLDQWTRFNVVSDNEVFNNNGAGIIVYDAGDAQVLNNKIYNNMIDSLGTHVCCKANIVVTSASAFETGKTNYVNNVAVSGNWINSDKPSITSIFVDAITATKNVTINNNTTP